jgi:hypothetical protein
VGLEDITTSWTAMGFDPFDSLPAEDRKVWWELWQKHDAYMEKLLQDEEAEHKRNCKLWKCSRCRKPKRPSPSLPPTTKILTLEDALDRLERVRRKPGGKGWTALCPAHDDRSPSLLVREHRDRPGWPAFHCSAGCHPMDIVAVLKASASTSTPI